jgi:hypothetical protein
MLKTTPGLKPELNQTTYAALKGRSSTSMQAFVTFSAVSEASTPASQKAGLPGTPVVPFHKAIQQNLAN